MEGAEDRWAVEWLGNGGGGVCCAGDEVVVAVDLAA